MARDAMWRLDWKSRVIDAPRIWTLAEARQIDIVFWTGSRSCPWDPDLGSQNVRTASLDYVLPRTD